MAEQIPYGIAANLLTKLGSAVFRETGLMFGVGDELRKLEDTLSIVRAVLLDAEEKQETSHAVSVWVSRLNDVVYDADDLFDDLEAVKLRRETEGLAGRVSGFFSSSNPLAFRIKMGHRIKAIRESLDDVANDISKFNFIHSVTSESDGPVRNRGGDRETCSVVEKSHKIVGRHQDKKQIVDLLMSMQSSSGSENLSLVAIVGMGGLGKTTLAQLVYNDQGMSNHFDLKMWVCVSDDFNVTILVRSVIKSATKSDVPDLALDQLQQLLRQHLDEKRYLLVLDDVWNEDPKKWGQFITLLPAGANGSKLLVTTRSSKVAAVMGIDSPYVVEGLNEDESWELFESLAFRKGEECSKCCSNLVEIGKEIAKMCRGVPLAIETIGRILYFKTPQESQWLSIKNNRSLISLGDENNDILPVLRLSYDHLPVQLKNCFAYCALFPKDYEMEKRSLVQLWMAQGYIQPSLENECLEDVGEEYFEDLFSRSLFQEFEGLNMRKGPYCYYKMHDLIHDLAQSVVKSNMITLMADNVPNIIPRKVHHVSSFEETIYWDLPKDLLDKPIRTVYMERSEVTSRSVSRLKCSRVMKIEFNDPRVLTSLAKLSHLRYLDLSHMRFEYLPRTIARLKHLQTLKLNHCNRLRELPENMKKLINLRHLEIDECSGLRYMPRGLGELTQLQTLTQFLVGGESDSDGRLWELKPLDNLRGQLEIVELSSVRWCSEAKEAILGGKQYLESLTLYWTWGVVEEVIGGEEAVLLMESLQPHPNLKELLIYDYPGVTFPNWMMNDGLHLLLPYLVRFTLSIAKACQDLPPFGQLPSLRYLQLEYLTDVVCMKDNYYSLGTSSLSAANRSALILFPSLKKLRISGMPKLKGLGRRDAIAAAEHALFPSLEDLTLAGITAALCSHLMMGASCSLKRLDISEILDLTCLPEEGVQHLSNLQKLSIEDCPNMTTLPSSIGLLTSLTQLSISNLPNMTTLPSSISLLTSLIELSISSCPMTTLPSSIGLLTSLTQLSISYLPNMTTLPSSISLLTSLTELSIRYCSNMATLPSSIGLLTSLTELSISYCHNLTSLPEEMQSLRNLLRLVIKCCHCLSQRCQKDTGDDWPNISHIPNISIINRDYDMCSP